MTSTLLDGFEWVVVDYSVDMENIEAYSGGSKSIIGLSLNIKGTDGQLLKWAGKQYTLTGSNLLSTSLIKTEIYNGQYVFQLPKGCTDYLIEAKAAKGSVAYIKGE